MPCGIYTRTKQTRENIGRSKLGQIPWNKGIKTGHTPWNKGKHHSEETKRKVSETKKKQKRRMSDEEKKRLSDYNKSIGRRPPVYYGKDCPSWRGGKSFEAYTINWTNSLRISIRERDKYTCQICGDKQGDEAFCVHHIDYNKKNCNTENLVTLCRSCHAKTGFNREKWKIFFKTTLCMDF